MEFRRHGALLLAALCIFSLVPSGLAQVFPPPPPEPEPADNGTLVDLPIPENGTVTDYPFYSKLSLLWPPSVSSEYFNATLLVSYEVETSSSITFNVSDESITEVAILTKYATFNDTIDSAAEFVPVGQTAVFLGINSFEYEIPAIPRGPYYLALQTVKGAAASDFTLVLIVPKTSDGTLKLVTPPSVIHGSFGGNPDIRTIEPGSVTEISVLIINSSITRVGVLTKWIQFDPSIIPLSGYTLLTVLPVTFGLNTLAVTVPPQAPFGGYYLAVMSIDGEPTFDVTVAVVSPPIPGTKLKLIYPPSVLSSNAAKPTVATAGSQILMEVNVTDPYITEVLIAAKPADLNDGFYSIEGFQPLGNFSVTFGYNIISFDVPGITPPGVYYFAVASIQPRAFDISIVMVIPNPIGGLPISPADIYLLKQTGHITVESPLAADDPSQFPVVEQGQKGPIRFTVSDPGITKVAIAVWPFSYLEGMGYNSTLPPPSFHIEVPASLGSQEVNVYLSEPCWQPDAYVLVVIAVDGPVPGGDFGAFNISGPTPEDTPYPRPEDGTPMPGHGHGTPDSDHDHDHSTPKPWTKPGHGTPKPDHEHSTPKPGETPKPRPEGTTPKPWHGKPRSFAREANGAATTGDDQSPFADVIVKLREAARVVEEKVIEVPIFMHAVEPLQIVVKPLSNVEEDETEEKDDA